MKRVLVVDDTKNIRTLLTTCLELNGYNVLTANNGTVALDIITKETFDLIFLDIKMPEISGTEVLRRIRNLGLSVPVVIMTAFATVKNAVDCTKLGAVAYLQKPFTADKVKNLLLEMEKINAPAENSIESYLSNAKSLINENKTTEAFQILKKALSLSPDYGEIYTLISLVYEKKGDLIKSKKFEIMAEELKKTTT